MQAFNHEILSIATGPAAPLFPPLNQEEREILSQIIKLTPPNTNAFNALLSPYENTLRRYRIDPKIDDKYYTFLLKLSLIPGSDWKQKWARVLSDQAISPELPPKQAIVPTATQVHPISHDPRRIKQTVYSGTQDKEKWKAINSNVKPATHQTATHSNPRPQKSVHFLPSKAEENVHNPIKESPAARDLSLPVELQSEILQSRMTLLIDPIDVKARKFRREQLLARCMNKWMNSIIYWNTLNSEAQSARRVLDISTAYQAWTRKFRNRENKLKLVDTSYNTRLG
jgi:protein SFI1